MIKREIVDQLVDSWAYLEADAEHWQSTDIGGPLEIEEPCWHIFVFHERLVYDLTYTYKCGACGELKRIYEHDIYHYVPANYSLQKQGPPPHLHYYDNSMRAFGRQLGFAPYKSMANCIARIDGLELGRAKRIAQHILRD